MKPSGTWSSGIRALHPLPVSAIDRRRSPSGWRRSRKRAAQAQPTAPARAPGAFFVWAIRSGFLEARSCRLHRPGGRARRARCVLSDSELRALWLALGNGDYGTILKLLLLTGARRDEVGRLSWSEIDWATATIVLSPARTKNRREHIIPLSPPALAILEARRRERGDDAHGFVFGRDKGRGFQGWSSSRRDFEARLAASGEMVADWRAHDFRRSLSTLALHRAFVIMPPHVNIEIVLGHVGGHKSGESGTYNKALYLDERRHAPLTRWGEHIVSLAGGETPEAKVIKLR